LHFFETLNYLFMFYGLFTTGILGFFFSFLKKPICKSLIYIYNTLYPIFQIFPPSFLLPFKFPCSLLGEFSALFLCYFRLKRNDWKTSPVLLLNMNTYFRMETLSFYPFILKIFNPYIIYLGT
jgi:hypothetical protein